MNTGTKKLSFKVLCILLTIAILVVSLPMSAFALALENTDTALTEKSKEISKYPIELPERRTENSKTFKLEDGTLYLAQYDDPIHYLDENGSWQDIDNTLSTSGDEIQTATAKIKFAKQTTGNQSLFTLHKGDSKLTLSLDGANKRVAGKISNSEEQPGLSELGKMTTLEHLSTSVLYENILDGTDIEYVLNGLDIKENIIVRQPAENYSYSFEMSLNNLEARMNEDGEIIIYEPASENTVYRIPAPFMFDAEGNTSNAVSLELTDGENGKYGLRIVADSAWINTAGRAFPVTIDPPLYSEYSASVTDLELSMTSSESNATGELLYLESGKRIYWKLNTLPQLPASAYIVDATFTATSSTTNTMNGAIGVYEVTSNWDSTLNRDKINAASNPQGATASNFTDYEEMFYYDVNDPYVRQDTEQTWNITPLVKKWYEGQNYGLMLTPVSEVPCTGTAIFHSGDNSLSFNRPILCIKYTDMKGFEDYWSFTSQSAGFAGTASINNATGKLVVTIPTLTTPDALMPITPTLVYNALSIDHTYSSAGLSDVDRAISGVFGHGFKLNLCETIEPRSYQGPNIAPKTYYVWLDSDGTAHAFREGFDEGIFEDEDGLQMTLTVENGKYIITDASKTKKTFTISGSEGYGYLTSIEDLSGNKVIFDLNSNNLPTAVKLKPNGLPEITQLVLTYADGISEQLKSISNPLSEEKITFYYCETLFSYEYDSLTNILPGFLRKIEYSVGTQVKATATYDYDFTSSDECRINKITNHMTGYSVSYTYDSAQRVTQVTESAANGSTTTTGQQISLSYGTSSTVIRTSGTDDLLGNSDDLLTTYAFDSSGRTVSCYTTDLERTQIYGASSGQYVGGDGKAKNNLKSSVQTTQQSSNYIFNGGFEESPVSSSSIMYWGKSGNVSIVESNTYQGYRAAVMSVNATTTESSLFQTLMIMGKGKYSFSAMINTNNIPAGTKVFLFAYCSSYPELSVTEEIPVNEYSASGGYILSGLTLEAPAEDTSFTVYIKVTGTAAASVYVDNVMFSKTTGPAEFDMLHEGNFEYHSGNYYPEEFWSIERSDDDITVAQSGDAAFGYSLKMDPKVSESLVVKQNISFADEAMREDYVIGMLTNIKPRIFTISAWAKGTMQTYSLDAIFHIMVILNYYNGNSIVAEDTYVYDFDPGMTDWQFICGGFTSNPSKGLLDYITIEICYEGHPGVGYFDDISLVMDSNSTRIFDYNAQGYIDALIRPHLTTWYSYDDHNNLTSSIASNQTKIEYVYDNKHRLIRKYNKWYTGTFDPDQGMIINGSSHTNSYTDYVYTEYGQISSVKTYASNGEYSFWRTSSSTEYNTTYTPHIWGTVSSQTDSLGNVTRYFYDQSRGWLLATISPKELGMCYKYDDLGNLIEILPAYLNSVGDNFYENTNSASANYSYDIITNRMTAISTESTTYTFSYDIFGNTDTINIGSRNIVDFSYNATNGKLNMITYGNGLQIQYVYDMLDRVSEVQYNVGEEKTFQTVYSYTYDSEGRIFSLTDHINNETTVYKYDYRDKMIHSYIYDITTYKNLYGSNIIYDEQSRISLLSHNLQYKCDLNYANTDVFYYSYLYDEETGYLDSLSYMDANIDLTIRPVYDHFGRSKSRNLTFDINQTEGFYQRFEYQYKTNGNNHSSQVSTVLSRTGIDISSATTKTYNYTYDANGNIIKVTDAFDVVQYRYSYDDLGQLKREDNRELNVSYVYEYDNAGNKIGRKRYAFTTGTLGAVLESDVYSYGDSSWGDLLTQAYGLRYEYDELGNIVKYGVYDEEEGRIVYGALCTWSGRQLVSTCYFEEFTSGSVFTYDYVDYTYNADGIRTSKTVYGVEHKYTLAGNQIISETWTDGNIEHLLVFIYDEAGKPIGLKYRNSSYRSEEFDYFFFEKNFQGDIIALYNDVGGKIGTYTYDAWGNCTAIVSEDYADINFCYQMVVNYNPFRYRGYYYDVENEWYYLQSRYYEPTFGRFWSANDTVLTDKSIVDYNLFVYCGNQPISRKSCSGQSWESALSLSTLFASDTRYSDYYKAYNSPTTMYSSADAAAMAFGNFIYSSTLYTMHEHGTAIYSITRNGMTWYGYAGLVEGDVHSINLNPREIEIPADAYTVATIHTHPNGNTFSGLKPGEEGDIQYAAFFGINIYVVSPNLKLQKYDLSSGLISVVGNVHPEPLSDLKKKLLYSRFIASWNNHIASGECEKFKCHLKLEWPNDR